MSENAIYTQMIRPAGILRVLFFVFILAVAAGLWRATDIQSLGVSVIPFVLWGTVSTLSWLLMVTLTALVLRLRFFERWRQPLLNVFCSLWFIVLGALCGGFSGALVHINDYELLNFWPVQMHWPGMFWGGIVAAIIVEWFYWHARGQKPAATEAKLMELQARIRPHFLFNTLNSAIALVRLDPQAAETVLQSLSQLFRAALESGQSSNDSLQQEVALVKSYLFIEAYRLGERLNVEWDLDEDTLSAMVPALSLQPIIENAVKHGIEPSTGKGKIIVKSRKRLGKVTVTVLNTMPKPGEQMSAANQVQKGHGMALQNLRSRLSLIHDFEGSLKTKSMLDKANQGWFVTTFEVPVS